ncbi:hypothetical protein AMTR_s00144p00067150 [Amborella trichopoda]|uniref:Retrotransposon gag domain-containing protein n=1 Tax=Amborella trichopoda TaxID=13333 RepID=W1P7W4_AMBTC|nr:hypothetical protein AMTR_s00144p00067150 [Amborella trichopoda]
MLTSDVYLVEASQERRSTEKLHIRDHVAKLERMDELETFIEGCRQWQGWVVDAPPKIHIPEPRCYDGARDAKELENFLWDIEQDFWAVRCEEDAMVPTATMYLTGDAKLWWRTNYEDMQSGRCKIDIWEDHKRELKAQFLLENVEYLARKSLKKLKQMGSIREYVKQFSALMLEIRDMSEKDKLVYFLDGLQPWAKVEI